MQILSQFSRILDETEKASNKFETLGLDENATENDEREALPQLLAKYQLDQLDTDLEKMTKKAIVMRLIKASSFLADHERRNLHRRYVMYRRGYRKKDRWLAIKEAILL